MFWFDMANLAVVGAGIGGCSAAYFARKYYPGIDVTIYEATERIGGRILTCNVAGANLELGASFLSSFNRTLLDLISAEQLKLKPVEESSSFSIWNGSKLAFTSNTHSAATALMLMSKYKLSLTRTLLLLRKVKTQINQLYENQNKTPADLADLFGLTGLDRYYQKTFSEILKENGASSAFITEFVTPVTKVIYSQSAELGGFAGLASLIGVYSGAASRFVQGNNVLPEHLAEKASATVKLSHKVERIEKMLNGSYRVHAGSDRKVFDAVIIATPLETANLAFSGALSVPDWEPQTYQTVYHKVMRGTPNLNYFGLQNSAEPPALILTTKDADPLTRVSFQKTQTGDYLVTFSSTAPLEPKKVGALFEGEPTTVLDHCWKAAYPIFKPLTKLPPTCLDKRLMYINAVEPSVASMETSTLSALNAVRMLSLPAQQASS